MPEPRRLLRGKFIRQQICSSKDVARLIDERGPWAGLIFERLILWADDDGRLVCEPKIVKSRCLPWHNRSSTKIRGDLDAMNVAGLLTIYEENGKLYGAFPNWRKHQPKQKDDRYAPSELPAPPSSLGTDPEPNGNQAGTKSEPTRRLPSPSPSILSGSIERPKDALPSEQPEEPSLDVSPAEGRESLRRTLEDEVARLHAAGMSEHDVPEQGAPRRKGDG